MVALAAAACSAGGADELTPTPSTSSSAPSSSTPTSSTPTSIAAEGDFYQPADPLPPGPLGEVLRREPLAVRGGASAWRVLYRSQGVDGRPVAVSGMVVQPAGLAGT